MFVRREQAIEIEQTHWADHYILFSIYWLQFVHEYPTWSKDIYFSILDKWDGFIENIKIIRYVNMFYIEVSIRSMMTSWIGFHAEEL